MLGDVNKLFVFKSLWQHPAMFCLYTFPAHSLNFHWRWRWWDRIQAIFLNLFYFKDVYLLIPWLFRILNLKSLIFFILHLLQFKSYVIQCSKIGKFWHPSLAISSTKWGLFSKSSLGVPPPTKTIWYTVYERPLSIKVKGFFSEFQVWV